MDLVIQSAFRWAIRYVWFKPLLLITSKWIQSRTSQLSICCSVRCVGSCNALNDLSDKVCVPNKSEGLNLSVFNMIAEINESKVVTKHISCKCKCRFDERKCNSDQWWNNDKCGCECKKPHVCEKVILGILLNVALKMENI